MLRAKNEGPIECKGVAGWGGARGEVQTRETPLLEWGRYFTCLLTTLLHVTSYDTRLRISSRASLGT